MFLVVFELGNWALCSLNGEGESDYVRLFSVCDFGFVCIPSGFCVWGFFAQRFFCLGLCFRLVYFCFSDISGSPYALAKVLGFFIVFDTSRRVGMRFVFSGLYGYVCVRFLGL